MEGNWYFRSFFFFFLLKILDEYDGKYLSSKKKGLFLLLCTELLQFCGSGGGRIDMSAALYSKSETVDERWMYFLDLKNEASVEMTHGDFLKGCPLKSLIV